jgi:hypothetical protein
MKDIRYSDLNLKEEYRAARRPVKRTVTTSVGLGVISWTVWRMPSGCPMRLERMLRIGS